MAEITVISSENAEFRIFYTIALLNPVAGIRADDVSKQRRRFPGFSLRELHSPMVLVPALPCKVLCLAGARNFCIASSCRRHFLNNARVPF